MRGNLGGKTRPSAFNLKKRTISSSIPIFSLPPSLSVFLNYLPHHQFSDKAEDAPCRDSQEHGFPTRPTLQPQLPKQIRASCWNTERPTHPFLKRRKTAKCIPENKNATPKRPPRGCLPMTLFARCSRGVYECVLTKRGLWRQNCVTKRSAWTAS